MTLVLLPAIGLDARGWDWLDGGVRAGAITPTYPGVGGRAPATADYSIADLADEIASEVQGDFDVVGVSMGGMVAQQLALRHAGRVRSMVLSNTTATVKPEPPLQRAALAAEGRVDELVELTLRLWFTDEALQSQPQLPAVSYARATLRASEPGSFARAWRAIAGHDVAPQCSAIHVPVTCLSGDDDVSTPPAVVEQLSNAIPGARLVRIAGPHLLPLERPAEFSAVVAEHLRWAAAASVRTDH